MDRPIFLISTKPRKENPHMEQVTLYYREGASDKVYQARIEPKENGFVVLFAYGRRGGTFTTGTKTPTPLGLAEARALYEKLVREKVAKGYTPRADGTPYHSTDHSSRISGVHCQLLNPVDEEQLPDLLQSTNHWLQEKLDGRRLLLRKAGAEVTGINRMGLTVAVPETLVSSANGCPVDMLMDGESIGDQLHVFDVLQIGQEDLRSRPYRERYVRLMNLLMTFSHRHLALVPAVLAPERKHQEFERLRASGAEGVVFKEMDAPYTAGRPAAGGTQLKHKFCDTASLIVGSLNAARSVSLLLFAGDKVVPAGNVTIPPNHAVPSPGSIVECRYLYAFPESGRLFQPVYLGTREDISAEECTTSQLKFRREPRVPSGSGALSN
jgi:bifunctional non-homologous end joining protein LigD